MRRVIGSRSGMLLPTPGTSTALALLLLAAGCSRGSETHAAARPAGPARRVILVTCDTLRADRLGCYGGARPASPRIDELARESLLFLNAWSAAPLTVPSLSGLLAGRPPDEIGVAARTNGWHMPESVLTLAEVARAAGFETAAIVSSSMLTRPPPELGDVGVPQGFDFYDDELRANEANRNLHERTAADCTSAVLRWLAGRPDDADRFLLWVHYQDPHGPYTAPEEDRLPFERDHSGEAELPLGSTPTGAGQIPDYQALAGLRRPGEYIDRYDAEIHHFDAELGRMLDGLRARGWLDDALLVLVADHGESLGENGWWFCHGETLQPELLRVPLLVRPPRTLRGGLLPESGGRRVAEPVCYLDVWPTVLEVLGIAPIENGGVSLLAPVRTEARCVSQSLGSVQFGRRWLSITDGRWRLLLPDPEAPRLYDMLADPAEQHDLAAARPDIVQALRRGHLEFLAQHARPALAGIRRESDDGSLRALRGLGYTLGDVDEH